MLFNPIPITILVCPLKHNILILVYFLTIVLALLGLLYTYKIITPNSSANSVLSYHVFIHNHNIIHILNNMINIIIEIN